ncbi:LLM class F420-dependent oxidoreductase [Gordonia sputi]
MRIGLLINYSTDFRQASAEALAATAEAVELLAVPEAYSFDAPSQAGYLAARAPGVDLSTSVIPIYSRTPTLTAMTAATLDYLTDGHFSLGLGTSGPQVVEGFHGVPYSAPLGRTREVIEICRAVWSGEKVTHSGRHYSLPLPAEHGTGLGKPLAMIAKPLRPHIPILIAALGPKNVALTAEIADGWQPMFFAPEAYGRVWQDALDAGTTRRSEHLGPLDIHAQVPLAFGGPGDPGHDAIKRHYALYIGGMGAPERNFYYRVACAYGFESAAAEIQRHYLAGDKQLAAQRVPDELIEMTALVGSGAAMREQLRRFTDAGTGTIYLVPFDADATSRSAAVAAACAANRTLDASRSTANRLPSVR